MARMLKQALHISARAPSPEPERLEDHIHAELVPELEGVGDRLLGAVDANWNAVDLVNLDALAESSPGELEDSDRWVVDAGRVLLSALDRDVHSVRHLGRELVEGERRDEADDSLRHPRRHGHEIGASQWRKVPQPKETPAQLLEDAGVAHRVEGLPPDAEAQSIRHADHAAAGADGIPLLGEHLPRTTRHGDIVAPLVTRWVLFVPTHWWQTQGACAGLRQDQDIPRRRHVSARAAEESAQDKP